MWAAASVLMSCGALVLAVRQYRYVAMVLAACLAIILAGLGLVMSLTASDQGPVATTLVGVATGVLVVFFVAAFVVAPTKGHGRASELGDEAHGA